MLKSFCQREGATGSVREGERCKSESGKNESK